MCVAEPALLTALHPDGTADVTAGDRVCRITLAALDEPAGVGDWLLVHGGVALHLLDPADVRHRRLLRDETRQDRP